MKKYMKNILAFITALSMPSAVCPLSDYVAFSEDVEVAEASFRPSLPHFVHVEGQPDDVFMPKTFGRQIRKSGISAYSRASALPSSFDMRDYGMVTSVKDQGQYGSCWTHSSACSAESDVIKSDPTVDLSELHTAYYAYSGGEQIQKDSDNIDDILNEGGNTGVVANLWSQWIGPVYESRLPYENTGFFTNESAVAEMKYQSDYHLENAYMFDYERDRSNFDDVNETIKQFILNGNAVDVSFYQGNYSYKYHSSNSSKLPKFANHAVTITGWDDDFPASNFNEKAEKDGAWLVKNSWGYESGDDGYMWISYEDKSLCQFAVYEMGDKNNYSVNYHHDTFIPTQSLSAYDDLSEIRSSHMANIFTAESDMRIDAISTYFQNYNTDYKIKIYTNLQDEADPSSGVPSAVTSGVAEYTGYTTVELDESVQVRAGEKFSVTVELECPENPFVIPVEASLFISDGEENGDIYDLCSYSTDEQIKTYTGKNESFFSVDGESWTDTTTHTYTFTGMEKQEVLESMIEEFYDGVSENDAEEFANAQRLENLYREIFSRGDLYINVGNISLKAFGNPTGKVEFSHVSGVVPSDEAVSLYSAEGNDILVSVNGGEYVPYTEPIDITENTVISAYTAGGEFTERTYTPEKAVFNDLCFQLYNDSADVLPDKRGRAKKVGDSEYMINITDSDNYIGFYPVTTAEITMNGEKIDKYSYTEKQSIKYGENTFVFELSEDGKISDTVTVRIAKSPVTFSLADEKIYFSDEFTVMAEDGKTLKSGDVVSGYAGQTVTAVSGENSIVCAVPERAEIPELEIDYYFETLGFIPNETAEMLFYSVKENPLSIDYVSAENRLIDGSWINSGMVMNKAFKVIPSEKLTLKVRAGNNKFASEPVTYEIPSAPPAPEEMPDFVKTDGGWKLKDYTYEIALPQDVSADVITKQAEQWGYKDSEQYAQLIRKRFGMESLDELMTVLESEWGVEDTVKNAQRFAVRYASTNNAFASECTFASVVVKGDVNFDGLIDSIDASQVLEHYASISTDGDGTLAEESLYPADYNGDGWIDSVDASQILIYYAELSTKTAE